MEYVPALLKSKRFWTAMLGTIVIVVSAFEPHLAEKFEQIVPAVIVIVGFVVGGYTIEDTVNPPRPPPRSNPARPMPPLAGCGGG